jgi:hypothetical protein
MLAILDLRTRVRDTIAERVISPEFTSGRVVGSAGDATSAARPSEPNDQQQQQDNRDSDDRFSHVARVSL